MAYVPYALLNADVNFGGNHSICLVTKDGSSQLSSFENLHKVFPTWETNDPFELQEIPLLEDHQVAEFALKDGHMESYVPENSETGEAVEKFVFNWLNPVGGMQPMNQSEQEAVRAKFKSRWDLLPLPSQTAKQETPVEKIQKAKTTAKSEPAVTPEKKSAATPARKVPAAKKEVRKLEANEVSELLAKKMFGTTELSEDQEAKHSDTWFTASDELFGKNVTAETAEQFGQLADKLGV